MYFGDEDDYIFRKDKSARAKKLANMNNIENPLHPNYWKAQICNYSDDIKVNVKRMVDFILEPRIKAIRQHL